MTLSYRHFPAGEKGFFRAPVLITGPAEGVLIDGGFTYSDGRLVLEAIRASGRKLTAVYISQPDPDYYFSLKPIKDAMPEVKVLAASATVDAIERSVEKKLAVWEPQLAGNGPRNGGRPGDRRKSRDRRNEVGLRRVGGLQSKLSTLAFAD